MQLGFQGRRNELADDPACCLSLFCPPPSFLPLDTVLPSSRPGSHYRDHHPLRSAAHFLTVADQEIKTLGLDTCDGKLSSELALYVFFLLPQTPPPAPPTFLFEKMQRGD